MIDHLLIQNFQKFSRLRVDFDPQITVLVGPSDTGKSTTLRALRWVGLNAAGDSFIKHGERGTTVQVFAEGRKITRRRGDNVNTYLLDDAEFKAFGVRVPDPIQSVLNLSPLNFQDQHDAAYWFSTTAGEVSRQLNAIVDLSVIDESLSAISKRIRSSQLAVEINRTTLSDAKSQRDSLAWVLTADIELQHLEALNQKKVLKTTYTVRLADLILRTRSRQQHQQTVRQAISSGVAVVELGAAVQRQKMKVDRLLVLTSRIRKSEKIRQRPIPDITRLEDLKKQIQSKSTGRLIRWIQTFKKSKATHDALVRRYEGLKEKKEAVTGVICPTCRRPIDV